MRLEPVCIVGAAVTVKVMLDPLAVAVIAEGPRTPSDVPSVSVREGAAIATASLKVTFKVTPAPKVVAVQPLVEEGHSVVAVETSCVGVVTPPEVAPAVCGANATPMPADPSNAAISVAARPTHARRARAGGTIPRGLNGRLGVRATLSGLTNHRGRELRAPHRDEIRIVSFTPPAHPP
ncbi:MAG TPA: hypothetical protein VMU75_01125 [Acidimicrobiales bacterium]|nr:hypothetical protein [Acidimicrobiales bacterium]